MDEKSKKPEAAAEKKKENPDAYDQAVQDIEDNLETISRKIDDKTISSIKRLTESAQASAYSQMGKDEKSSYMRAIEDLAIQIKDSGSASRAVSPSLLTGSQFAAEFIDGTLQLDFESIVTINRFLDSDAYKTYQAIFMSDVDDYFQKAIDRQQAFTEVVSLADLCDNLTAIAPIAYDTLNDYKNARCISSAVSFEDFIGNHDTESPYHIALARLNKKEKKTDPSSKATPISGWIGTPSVKPYQNFLTGLYDHNFRDGVGVCKYDDKQKKYVPLTKEDNYDQLFVQVLLPCYLKMWEETGTTSATITINISEFDKVANSYKHDSHKTKTSRADERMQRYNYLRNSFHNLQGRLEKNGKTYSVFDLGSYDPETGNMTGTSLLIKAYLEKIEEINRERQKRHRKELPPFSSHLSTTVRNERNKEAALMANRICQGLSGLGTTKPNKKNEFVYRISCASLIKDVPEMQIKLDGIAKKSDKTKILKRTFSRMYKILHDKSDIFDYYKDLQITEVIPSYTTLSGETTCYIEIVHKGKNPDFRREIY